MPAFFAHYQFGKTVLQGIPMEERQCISRFRRVFDLGLQGPDFFFYYNPLMKTKVGALGGQYHEKTGRQIFAHAVKLDSTEVGRAYLYGLLAHYCLDTHCHPFVDKMEKQGKARHVALESEFDRYMMVRNGIAEPHKHSWKKKIHLTRGECVTVSEFYPPATGADVMHSVRRMAWVLDLLTRPNRSLLQKLMHRVDPKLCDSLIPEEPVEEFARMDSELLLRWNRAVEDYPKMLAALEQFRKDGSELTEAFAYDFMGKEEDK